MSEKMVEAISEETLEEIAGGLNVSSNTVRRILKGAGVTILAAGAGALGFVGGMFAEKKGLLNFGKKKD